MAGMPKWPSRDSMDNRRGQRPVHEPGPEAMGSHVNMDQEQCTAGLCPRPKAGSTDPCAADIKDVIRGREICQKSPNIPVSACA